MTLVTTYQSPPASSGTSRSAIYLWAHDARLTARSWVTAENRVQKLRFASIHNFSVNTAMFFRATCATTVLCTRASAALPALPLPLPLLRPLQHQQSPPQAAMICRSVADTYR